jgi:DUF2075 family protein/SOS-response transcriptional repressor LexA/DNA replication protein DnaC
MIKIESFQFKKDKLDQVKTHYFGKDWPVVYLLRNQNEIYIGETTNLYSRSNQHLENSDRRRLRDLHVITDEEYNKSAALDIESWLIQHVAAEGTYQLQNGNKGLLDHNYYDRDRYRAKFDAIWSTLQSEGIITKDLIQVKNSDLFKFSPYKALTADQLGIARKLIKLIKRDKAGLHIINGDPGTGKTILAIFLLKYLQEEKATKHLSVGLVVPMGALRKTLRRVFRHVKGLKPGMVIGPTEVSDKKYDVLIVDEAHRLRRRNIIMGYGGFDAMNEKLGFDEKGTELDWIMRCSKHQILFYDHKQSIRPADIPHSNFKKLGATHHRLESQMRVAGGVEYIQFVNDLFDGEHPKAKSFKKYDFRIYEDLSQMVGAIKQHDKEFNLCRVVAGFAWPWLSKSDPRVYDIKIGGVALRWNTVHRDWVNSKNAINEVGCIHTVQGYDLNYVGVIVGPELGYDPKRRQLIIRKENYKDSNGWRGISDPKELERYILNIYKTLMTRGMKGCYVYFVDKDVEKFFKERIYGGDSSVLAKQTFAPVSWKTIPVPLVGSAPCGKPFLGEENIEDHIEVDARKIHKGFKYFIVRAEGDSMNLAGIKNGDLLLCRQQEKANTGDKVIALLGGDNVTIKEYGPRENGVRLLFPKSSNKKHQPIIPGEGDTVQGVVQESIIRD